MSHNAALLLLVIALGALASPAIGRRIGIPAAVVEIVFGILVGASGIADDLSVPAIRFLADLGFALFLFLAGVEVDARGLRQGGIGPFVGSFLMACSASGLAFLLCVGAGWSPWVALALGATSVPLLLAVVREQGLTHHPLGRQMVTAAAIGEVVTVGLAAFGEVLSTAHGFVDALVGLARLLALLGLVILGTRLLTVLRWWFPEHARGLLTTNNAAETGVRAGFGLTFAMIAAAALAGVEPLLGAFVGGLMVSFAIDDKHVIEEKFGTMAYGFFVPVFFVDVGLRLGPVNQDVAARIPQILLLSALMFAVKLLPGLGWIVMGRPLRQVVASSLLLAAPLTMVIAVADLAGRLGAIDEGTEGVLVLVGMLSSLLYPSLARRLMVVRGSQPARE